MSLYWVPRTFVPVAASVADAMKLRVGLSRAWQKILPSVVVLLLLIFALQSRLVTNGGFWTPTMQSQSRERDAGNSGTEAGVKAAGNSTLGFSSIVYLNLKSRYDRLDAMILQGFLSGLDITPFPGVDTADISASGLPPTRNPGRLLAGEIACWRAHANVWARVLQEKLGPVLIVEGDATWDVNIRTILPQFNRMFRKLLHKVNSTALPNPKWAPNKGLTANDTDDPWISSHWDILILGNCISEVQGTKHNSVAYFDPYAAQVDEALSLGGQRMVYRTWTMSCTTSYAVSQTGAAKMLLRTMTDLDEPIDMIMRGMIERGELVAYHMEPPMMAQWMYVGGIGKDSVQSDIHADERKDEAQRKEAWDEVEQTRNVWHYWHLHSQPWRFNGSALKVAGNRILGKKAPLG